MSDTTPTRTGVVPTTENQNKNCAGNEAPQEPPRTPDSAGKRSREEKEAPGAPRRPSNKKRRSGRKKYRFWPVPTEEQQEVLPGVYGKRLKDNVAFLRKYCPWSRLQSVDHDSAAALAEAGWRLPDVVAAVWPVPGFHERDEATDNSYRLALSAAWEFLQQQQQQDPKRDHKWCATHLLDAGWTLEDVERTSGLDAAEFALSHEFGLSSFEKWHQVPRASLLETDYPVECDFENEQWTDRRCDEQMDDEWWENHCVFCGEERDDDDEDDNGGKCAYCDKSLAPVF